MEPLAADDPRRVGDYRLTHRIGAGGMGQVYLGRSSVGRAVAVKVVHRHLAADASFMARFRNEVEAAKAVSGAFTAPVVAAGVNDSPPWLATAYVAGPSLQQLVRGTGPLPEAAVWKLAGGLVEALQAIHGCGLIHRDLNPRNILLAVDGPKVIDFGISRIMEGTSLTTPGFAMGTPPYMSPEQIGAGDVGPQTDVFALGGVIVFAVTGAAPFGSGEASAVVYRIAHTEPDLSRVPPGLLGIVSACLNKDPRHRPSLGQLLGAIAIGSAAFPEIPLGNFWPDPVPALLASFERQSGSAGPGMPVTGAPWDSKSRGRERAFDDPAWRPPAASRVTNPPVTNPPVINPPGRDAVGQRRTARRRWLVGISVGGTLSVAVAVTLTLMATGSTSISPPPLTPTTATASGPAAGSSQGSTPAAAVTPPSSPASSTSQAVVRPPSSPASSISSASVSQANVMVCISPGGCSGFTGNTFMMVKPSDIDASSGSCGELVWSGWTDQQATSTGTQMGNGGNCTVTVSDLVSYIDAVNGDQFYGYSTIVVQFPGGNTTSYSINNVP